MDGKITLEEHWAIDETLDDAARSVGHAPWFMALAERLKDFHGPRIEEMDQYGIAHTLLSLNAPAIQGILDTDAAIALAAKTNDALAEAIAKHPDRLGGFAALPMQDPDAAAAELTRCVEDLGFKGAMVNGFTQKDVPDSAIYFDLPEYWPFWATVEALDVPFYLHPRTQIPTRAQEYDGHSWLLGPHWGFARETSIHALRLIGSGIFDEFPKIQLVLGHLGERIPYDIWRIDARIDKAKMDYQAAHSVRHYMNTNVHITTAGHFSTPTLHCALAEMGADRVMFSIDYPFEDTVDGASWFDALEMDPDDKQKIGRDNAVKLFKLSGV